VNAKPELLRVDGIMKHTRTLLATLLLAPLVSLHAAEPIERSSLGGIWMHEKGLVNLAPQTLVQTRAHDDASAAQLYSMYDDIAVRRTALLNFNSHPYLPSSHPTRRPTWR
jgi:hypothetical protein